MQSLWRQEQARFWTLVEFVIILQISDVYSSQCFTISGSEKDVVCHSHTADALQTFHPEESAPSGPPGSPDPAEPAEWRLGNMETVPIPPYGQIFSSYNVGNLLTIY